MDNLLWELGRAVQGCAAASGVGLPVRQLAREKARGERRGVFGGWLTHGAGGDAEARRGERRVRIACYGFADDRCSVRRYDPCPQHALSL